MTRMAPREVLKLAPCSSLPPTLWLCAYSVGVAGVILPAALDSSLHWVLTSPPLPAPGSPASCQALLVSLSGHAWSRPSETMSLVAPRVG